MLDRQTRIFVAGHRGLVGGAIARRLQRDGFDDLVLRTRDEVDLFDADAVDALFAQTQPQVVVLAAARVGGIAANIADPSGFLLDNLAIQANVLQACQRHGVAHAVFLGSSCIYPRDSPQPMREEYFMTGPVEPTNESYAVAKIAGIRLARALHEQHQLPISLPMPSNVYGPGDHFELDRAHVVSSLVRRFTEAKRGDVEEVVLWGTGTARRELLHVDDLADAISFLLDAGPTGDGLLNVGTGVDHSIADLATYVMRAVGYEGAIEWDHSKPDGMPRKVMDVSKLAALGWKASIGLEAGVASVIEDFGRRHPSGPVAA